MAIEAATENEEVKKSIFRSLQPHLKPDTLLASNTSSDLDHPPGLGHRPPRAVHLGLHFMNPVPLMKLVEIIRGIATDVPTYERAVAFAQSLGKITSNAEDFPPSSSTACWCR
ncbi:3-hydroxyacyl-CoA dehydrogenase NAD-binding domain-containing protein [Caulobacter segnis]